MTIQEILDSNLEIAQFLEINVQMFHIDWGLLHQAIDEINKVEEVVFINDDSGLLKHRILLGLVNGHSVCDEIDEVWQDVHRYCAFYNRTIKAK